MTTRYDLAIVGSGGAAFAAAVGVKTGSRGEVIVDEQLRTHHPRIWAAGDVTGRPQFVHVAGAQGTLVVDIATAVSAMANRMTVRQLAELWCPYLTMAEGLKLAAQSFTRDVTTLSCCAT